MVAGRVRVAIAMLGLLVMFWSQGAGAALAQGGGPPEPIVPQHSDPAWQAAYWNNMDLSGAPILQRQEAAIAYNWGLGSPDPRIQVDHFSARWTRYVDLVPSRYRITATSDDGIRVAVDGRWVIYQWSVHSVQTYTAEFDLTEGHHLVTVEYFENLQYAQAGVTLDPALPAVPSWQGEYYNNTSLAGPPVLVRPDPQINFNWGSGSPAPGTLGGDYFSVRWTSTQVLPPGNYRFALTIDDGGRLWVNNHLLIDRWQVHSVQTFTGDIYLPGGSIPIKVEYFENAGLAVAQLTWTGAVPPPSQSPTPPPQPPQPPAPPPQPGGPGVMVAPGLGGFVKGGAPAGWSTALGGSSPGAYFWTYNNDRVRPDYNWARWYPNRAGPIRGRYEVFVYIPPSYSSTTAANYWVSHANGYTSRVVNQATHGGQWVSLGAYMFRGDDNDYISLADVTGEPFVSHTIAFDAVRWEPR